MTHIWYKKGLEGRIWGIRLSQSKKMSNWISIKDPRSKDQQSILPDLHAHWGSYRNKSNIHFRVTATRNLSYRNMPEKCMSCMASPMHNYLHMGLDYFYNKNLQTITLVLGQKELYVLVYERRKKCQLPGGTTIL